MKKYNRFLAEVNENMLRRAHVAVIIANSLGYTPENNQSPTDIIHSALESTADLSIDQLAIVTEMLDLAGECGIPYDPKLIPEAVEDPEEISDEAWTDEELDKMANSVDELDDIIDEYEDHELVVIDAETGEEAEEDPEEINEVLSRIQRIKAKVRFKKSATKRQRKLKIALKRHSTNEQINKRARSLAIKLIKVRLAKKPLNKLSIAEKERLERVIKSRKKVVNRLAMRLTSRVRMVEKKRLSRKPK